MSFVKNIIHRPVLTSVLSLLIILFGVISYLLLSLRDYPSVDSPIVTVTTNYPGANPEVIESQITEVIEESVNAVPGIRSIKSTSSDGRSTITIEFNLGVDIENAANDVRDKVSRAQRNLPTDIDPPIINKDDPDQRPIVIIAARSKQRNLRDLDDYARRNIKDRLQTIEGVSRVDVWGSKMYAMRLQMDPQRLTAYGLTPLDVRDALLRENVELPSGRLEGYNTELSIRTEARLTTEQEFDNMIVAQRENQVIRFKDVGKAKLLAENERTLLRGRGATPFIGVAVVPLPGSNYVEIADEIYETLEALSPNLPDDITVEILLDRTDNIRKGIKEVRDTILIAFTLVVLVVFFFLRTWRTTLVPVIAIPISLIGGFFVMWVTGSSINILTLLGIVLATGLVVDDAIVVMENIYSHIERGVKPFKAAVQGTKEIVFAVISTTITLVIVFIPILLIEGISGRLFREFAFLVSGTVVISSFISLTLTPMMSARVLRQKHTETRPAKAVRLFLERSAARYENALKKFLNQRWWAFVILGATGVVVVLLFLGLSSELAPVEDRSRLTINVEGPMGTTFDKMDEYMLSIIETVDTLPETSGLLANTSPSWGSSTMANRGFGFVIFKKPSERKRSQTEIKDWLSETVKDLSFARTYVSEEPTIGVGGLRGLPVQYVLQTPNFDSLEVYLDKFVALAREQPEFTFVNPDLDFNRPELQVEIDRERAALMGVSAFDISQTIQLMFGGQRFDYFVLRGKQYQVIGETFRQDRLTPENLRSIGVRNSMGRVIPLDQLVRLENKVNPPVRYRYNRFASATINASLAPGYTLGDGIEAMDRVRDEILPASFNTALDGQSKDFAESSSSLGYAFMLALMLVYLVLAAQFESFSDPLTIMLTVPLAIFGALLALWLGGHTLNIFSQIGMIVLIGIVTKNGILIVEFANQIKKTGATVREAVEQAAKQRFRPILMTSLSAILGALPIALALGESSTSRIPMGVVIIGGLGFSLLLTLFVIPSLYTYLSTQKTKGEEG